jgi:hypothetical protein
MRNQIAGMPKEFTGSYDRALHPWMQEENVRINQGRAYYAMF